MTDEEQGGSGSGFGWFLVGLGIGAAIGVLYAPQSGTETRESLAESARERAEYLKQKSRDAAAQVNTYVDSGKEQFGEYVVRGKQAVERGRSQVETYIKSRAFLPVTVDERAVFAPARPRLHGLPFMSPAGPWFERTLAKG
jgi:gas vesicle protein